MYMKISEKDISRIEHSKRNATTALVSSILMGLFSFAERTVFNQYFLADYLGLYSFFNNVINILITAELGITQSIAFALYAPLEYRNSDQIKAIMLFFKKAYIIIGSVILAAGLLFMPFMHLLLKTSVPMEKVYIYYLTFLVTTVINYYLTYKNVIFVASQNQYKITLVSNILWSILYLSQILIAIFTQNFLFYCIAISVANIFKDILLRIFANRDFPILKEHYKVKLENSIKHTIKRNIKGLVMTKLGSIMVSTTDSILISALVSTAFLGIYSNYQMITAGLYNIICILPSAVTASIGNIAVSESKEKVYRSFIKLDLGSYFIYSTICIILINIADPIISTFFGSNKVMPFVSLSLVILNFYIISLREILYSYKNSLGLYWYDRKRPIIEGITNLLTSIILGHYFGFNGIILGTIITNIIVNLIMEPKIIYHEGFEKSSLSYYYTQGGRILLTIGVSAISLFINRQIKIPEIGNLSLLGIKFNLNGIITIIIYALIAIITTIILYIIVFYKNKDAREILEVIKITIKRKRISK